MSTPPRTPPQRPMQAQTNAQEPPQQAIAPADPLLSVESVRQEVRRIAGLISDARAIISDGKLVPLSGLETLIRAVCNQATQLPPGHGIQVRGDLETLLYDLDALETDMTQRFGVLARRPLDETPRAPTVGAAYKAGMARAAQIERQKASSTPHPAKPGKTSKPSSETP